jgi:hypothetical protein
MDHGRRNRRGREGRDPDKDRARMHPVREDEQSSSRKTTARARIRRRGDRENGIRGPSAWRQRERLEEDDG